MIDPNDSTWHVEPFDEAAWIMFALTDRFLAFQVRDMGERIDRTLASGHQTLTRKELVRSYLEAYYNQCHEDSLLARKWNAFVKARTLKADRDQVSEELFGLLYSTLMPEQRCAVNIELQGRYDRAAGTPDYHDEPAKVGGAS
jgi:hypothetical protein